LAFIPQMEPSFDAAEADAVRDYMLSGGWVTEFKQTEAFENELAKFTGASDCIATNNGTVSLIIALLAAGVGPGDEVIVPDMTMIATPNAAKILGAVPVMVDVEPETLNISVAEVAAAITPKTKAVMHVSLNGRSNDLDALARLCRDKGICLVEDAAQSLGSYYGNRHLGTIGDIGSFSFSALKVITTGQGGALLTSNPELAGRIRKIKDFGRTSGGNDIHDTIGFNFKFTDIQAVIGLAQMRKLKPRLERKKEMWRRYRKGLEGVRQIDWIETDLKQVSPWFVDIFVDNRDGLQAHLKNRNIGSRPIYPPIHSQKAYGLKHRAFPVTERFAARGLWLPSSITLDDGGIDTVCAAVREFFGA
jgi:perosamine synthetase